MLGVAHEDPDIDDRCADRVGGDLCHGGDHALARVGQSDRALDATALGQPDHRAVAAGDGCTTAAVVGRRVVGILDEHREPDAAVNALVCAAFMIGDPLVLIGTQPVVVHQSRQFIEAGTQRQAFETCP